MSSNQNDETYNDYKTEGGEIPVQDDSAPVEDGVDAATADSDAQLGTYCTQEAHPWPLLLTVEN